jgi:hypothetical protein
MDNQQVTEGRVRKRESARARSRERDYEEQNCITGVQGVASSSSPLPPPPPPDALLNSIHSHCNGSATALTSVTLQHLFLPYLAVARQLSLLTLTSLQPYLHSSGASLVCESVSQYAHAYAHAAHRLPYIKNCRETHS